MPESSMESPTGPEAKETIVDPQSSGVAFATWRETLELLSKAVVAIVGMAYIAGLLIMNMHVREYGLTYLGFLQIEYIMVGMLWLFLVSLVFFAAGYLLQKCRELRAEKKPLRVGGLLLLLLIILFGTINGLRLVLALLSEPDEVLTFRGHWKSLGILFFTAASIFSVIYFTAQSVRQKGKQSNKWHDAFYVLQLLFWFLVPLKMYATSVYPTLSPAFGGGQTRRVAFVVNPEQLHVLEPLGVKLSHGRTTEAVEVIFEAPDFFLIRAPAAFPDPKPKAVRLKKEFIDTVFY